MQTTENHENSTDKSDPIDKSKFDTAKKEFRENYRATGGLTHGILSVSLEDELKRVFGLNPGVTSKGLMFHYGMNDAGTELCYIVSMGFQNAANDVKFRPFTASELGPGHTHDGYIMIEQVASRKHRVIRVNKFCAFKNNYKSKLEQKDATGNWEFVKNISLHPTMVFHQGLELNEFHNHYKSQSINLYLYLHHGSDNPHIIPKRHLPLLRFGDSGSEFNISNNSIPNGASRYTERALDAGHLCPPLCDTSQDTAYTC